jgi:predicted NAD/FAD-dependent oxidoreductase
MHIAIIGAGIAGLTCARSLQAQGNSVVIYEKSRGVSGRMSTRHNELGGFDHGAQYFTATSDTFKKQIAAWRKSGWIAPWDGKLVSLENGVATPAASDSGKQRFVGIPGMSALGKKMAQGMDVRTEQQVKRIEQYGDQWLLAIQSDTVAIEASAGPFDAVLIAVPADQAIPFLQVSPVFAEQAEAARLAPCWTLLMAFQEPLGLGYDGAWVSGPRLAWIAQDASKPQRRPGEHWVGQASAEWSIEHLEDDPERAKEKLLKAFHEATGSHVQPVYAAAHRWRFSQALHPVDADCLWDATLRLGACGDWFAAGLEGKGRIENAYLSGLALAEMLR